MENPSKFESTLIQINSPGMGRAEPELAVKLLKTYLTLLAESGTYPGAIAMFAEGVRLACEGSPLIQELQRLEQHGVHIILCSTCLNFYGLSGLVRVGVVGGMTDIIAAHQAAQKVITL